MTQPIEASSSKRSFLMNLEVVSKELRTSYFPVLQEVFGMGFIITYGLEGRRLRRSTAL